MILKKFFKFGMLFSLICLNSCGPMYNTRYHYTPPSNFNGMQCINQCLSNKSYCQSNCSANNQSCKANLQWLKIGETTARIIEGPRYHRYGHYNPYYYQPYYNSAADDLSREYNSGMAQCRREQTYCTKQCESNYNDCYQNCGGQVLVETYCYANCDKQ